jgi:aldehyde:ferredoxin oxidoreductase
MRGSAISGQSRLEAASSAAFIDLSSGRTAVREIPPHAREAYLGGRGVNAVFLHAHVPPAGDPGDPGRILLVGAGLLAGMPAPACAGAVSIAAMLPVSGLVGSLTLGGFFGAEMRFAGIEHLAIRGKAACPVYLWVHDGQIEIGNADAFRDADAAAATAILRDILDDEGAQVMAAGPTGGNAGEAVELRVDGAHCRQDSELGAVMAAKKLKAIAVRGSFPLDVHDPARALQHLRRLLDLAPPSLSPGQGAVRGEGSGHAAESDFLRHYLLLKDICRRGERNGLHDSVPAEVEALWRDECMGAVFDALGLKRPAEPLLALSAREWEECPLLVEAATGLRLSAEDLLRAGERICTREWLCNVRAGFSWGARGLYCRGQPITAESPPSGKTPFDAYGRLRGWDRTGMPLPETMRRLGLDSHDDENNGSGVWPEA